MERHALYGKMLCLYSTCRIISINRSSHWLKKPVTEMTQQVITQILSQWELLLIEMKKNISFKNDNGEKKHLVENPSS